MNRPPNEFPSAIAHSFVGLYLCEFLLSMSTLWKSREAILGIIATICSRNEVSKNREDRAPRCERMARPGRLIPKFASPKSAGTRRRGFSLERS